MSQPHAVVDVRIVQQPAKNYSICYVDFVSEEEATACLSIDRQNIDGRTIFVAKSKPPEKDDEKFTLFLNNLPFGLTEDELFKALKFCKPDIIEIRLKKSYAFVRFKDEVSMKKNLKVLKNYKIKDRKIVTTIADKPKKSGSHSQPENGEHLGKREKAELPEAGPEEELAPATKHHTAHAAHPKPHQDPHKRPAAHEKANAKDNHPDTPAPVSLEQPEPAAESESSKKKSGKSNKDFRKMFGL